MLRASALSASQAALHKTGWTHRELELPEIDSAFTAQAIAVNRHVVLDPSKINVNGCHDCHRPTPLTPPAAASS